MGLFVICVCLCNTAIMSVSSILLITCWERADILALLYVMFYCLFVTFSNCVLGQAWYLSVLCLLSFKMIIYFFYS